MEVDMSDFMGSLYNLKGPLKEWHTLQNRQPIPNHLRSQFADPSTTSVVGLGLVKAICRMLAGVQGTFSQTQDRWSICFPSSSSKAMRVLGGSRTTWWAETGVGYLVAVAAIVDAHLACNRAVATEFLSTWQQLLVAISATGKTAPYRYADLQALNGQCDEPMIQAVDALYHYLKKREPQVQVVAGKDPSPMLADPSFMDVFLKPTGKAAAPTKAPQAKDTALVKTLRRLIRRGGTALLVGQTGSGKTHAAKDASLKENCRLVLVKGRPGLDDRQFYGGVYPIGTGFQWIDGPLAEAWRLAANQSVALLIDELARLDGYHLAALIGALDSVKGSELNFIQGTQGHWIDHVDYYLLTLPTGERLVAPTANLTIIATSNLGSDYVQIQQAFDPALLRRFALHLEVERLEADQERLILKQHGLSDRTAQLFVETEKFTLSNLPTNGGLLQRPLNIGTLINWATEAKALADEGLVWAKAITEAASYTAIPYCCPRMSDGTLEQPAVKLLAEEINRLTAQK
jgi:MoxR-like ATPase